MQYILTLQSGYKESLGMRRAWERGEPGNEESLGMSDLN